MNYSPIRMVAMDLDGTAFGTGKMMSERLIRNIKECADRGIIVTVATGRPGSGIPEGLGTIEGLDFIIHENGARVIDNRTGSVILENYIKEDAVPRLKRILSENHVNIDVVSQGKAYISRKEYDLIREGKIPGRTASYVCTTRKPVDDIYELLSEKVEKIECIVVNYLSLDQKKEIDEKLSDVHSISLTKSFHLNTEIGGVKASKAKALDFLLEREGLSVSELMAIGDSHNDISMISFAGIGVAMGQSDRLVKEAADFETLSNDEDGCAVAIEKFVL